MLEKLRKTLDDNGLKISRDKATFLTTAENLHVNKLGRQSVSETKEFKYLGSTVDQKRDTPVDVKRRIQSGWRNWRKLTWVLCNFLIKLKSQVYANSAVCFRMLGSREDAREPSTRNENEMLRWTQGKT